MIRIRIRIKKNKVEIIIYRLKFIDSYRFIGYSLSILVDNISEINTKEHENSFIDKKQLYNPLIETFYNTYQLSNKDINKFALLLKKVFILMNIWIAGKDLMNSYRWRKIIITVNYI